MADAAGFGEGDSEGLVYFERVTEYGGVEVFCEKFKEFRKESDEFCLCGVRIKSRRT